MRLRAVVFTGFVLLVLAAGLTAWLSSPRVLMVTPPPGSQGLPGYTPFQLVFSQPMSADSLEAHLEVEPEHPGYLALIDNLLTFTPYEPWPSGQTITVTLKSGARAANGLGLPTWGRTTWQFEISEMLLAYLWPAGDLADLYALNPLTGQITRLTQSATVQDFTVSPDGKVIYYTVDLLRGGSLIIRLPLEAMGAGTPIARETIFTCENAACRNPAASLNGRWLAYEQVPDASGSAQIGIWLLDLDSGQSRPVDTSGHPGRYPVWSQTGWLAYYDLTDQAYRAVHPESGSTILLPNQIGEPGSWGPEGNVFLASEIFDESSELLISAASGHMLLYSLSQLENIQDLTQAYYLEDTGGVFAPNGQQIAFARKYLDPERWTAGRQLWVMDLTGNAAEMANARPLTDEPQFNHYSITWSPNSQYIAFMRFDMANITQLPELWLVQADGSNLTQLVIGGYAPQWIP